MVLPRHPGLYEIQIRQFLAELSPDPDSPLKLSEIPESVWTEIRELGFDMVWLMGIWQSGKRSGQIASSDERLQALATEVFGTHQGLIGSSPYSVRDYTVDSRIGTDEDLQKLRKTINNAGLKLILDFVPNHTAPEHDWVVNYPERYVMVTDEEFFSSEESFPTPCPECPEKTCHIANGRDPYFPPWTDTAQVNALSGDTRVAVAVEMLRVARMCDGLRVDMAMLLINRVFLNCWERWCAHTRQRIPTEEFWRVVIGLIRRKTPDCVLIAESYWGLGDELLNLGFDYVYGKNALDLLQSHNVPGYRQKLGEEGVNRLRRVRFLENHDEPRMASIFSLEAYRTAALIHAVSPGLRMFHHGQLEGKKGKAPIQFRKAIPENADPDRTDFYAWLMDTVNRTVFHNGIAHLLPVLPLVSPRTPGDSLVAFGYQHCDTIGVVVVNHGPEPSKAMVHFPEEFFQGMESVGFMDVFQPNLVEYVRHRSDLEQNGLFVRLDPYAWHVLVAQR